MSSYVTDSDLPKVQPPVAQVISAQANFQELAV